VRVLALRGRHRPQRCRQTDPRAGEAVAHVQATLRGWLKANAVVVVRLSQLPVHQEGQSCPSCHEEVPRIFPPLARSAGFRPEGQRCRSNGQLHFGIRRHCCHRRLYGLWQHLDPFAGLRTDPTITPRPRFRCLVPLSNMPAFLDVFGVRKGDAMFHARRFHPHWDRRRGPDSSRPSRSLPDTFSPRQDYRVSKELELTKKSS